MIPGEIIPADAAPLAANADLETKTLSVANTGDRPIQVGSHYHFFETNEALRFDRATSRGFRLNIPAGTVMSRISRGRAMLRRVFEEREIPAVAQAGQKGVVP